LTVALYIAWTWPARPVLVANETGRYQLHQGRYEASTFVKGTLATYQETSLFRIDTATGKTHVLLVVNGTYHWQEVDREPELLKPNAPSAPTK